MEYYGLTDIGLYRDKNEDSYMMLTNAYGDLLVLICDGIGGANAGEVASSEIIKYFSSVYESSGPFSDLIMAKEYIIHHMGIANRRVFELSKENPAYKGMGTTVTGLFYTSHGVLSINVGDSRVYGFADNKLFRLTTDHTLVNEMIANGQISFEESFNHPKKHHLVRAVGVWDSVDVDVHKVKDMDYYLACTDGLHGYVEADDLVKIIYREDLSVKERAQKLMDLALLKGGYDNITLVLVKH